MKAMKALLWSPIACLATVALANSQPNTVSMAIEAPPRSLDPRYAVDANSQYLENLTHCSLVTFDENGAVIGDLAADWKWRDNKTLEIKLKANGKFSDGRAIKPEDVKATYSFFARKDITPPSPRAGAFAKVASIDAVGADKVIFKLIEPDSSFVTNLVVGILPADLANGAPLEDPNKARGCGPFKITSANNQSIELERNSSYSLSNAAKPSHVSIKIVRDETTRFAKLRSGEIDIVQNLINRDELGKIASKLPNLKIAKRPGLNTTYLGFNFKDPILSKVEVRQAIAHAINRQQIIDYILQGYAKPAETLITPQDKFYKSSDKRFDFNPKVATELLDQAGLKDPDGKGPKPRFELTYKTTTDITRVSIAKAIASQLQKIGIKVNVQSLEWGRFKADVDAGNVQIWSLSWVGFKDPDIYRYAFASENFPPHGGNRGRYSNAQLDKLLTEARVTTDEKKRGQIYQQVQNLVNNELPYVFLWHEDIFAVLNARLQGFKLYADGRWTALRETHK